MVDLPAPLGPSSPKIEPRGIAEVDPGERRVGPGPCR